MKILEHSTGDISDTFPVHRKFGVSDTFPAHRTDGMHSAGTYDTYPFKTHGPLKWLCDQIFL